MRFYITLILFIVVLLIAVIFGSQNKQILHLNYLISSVEISVAMAVSLFTTLGFLLGLLFSFLWKFSRWLKTSKTTSLPEHKS